MDLEDTINLIFQRSPPEIKTKGEFYALYNAGLFGNKPLTWDSYEELMEDKWSGGICMRSTIVGVETIYNVQKSDLKSYILEWESKGIPESAIRFNQALPDDKLILQGEVNHTELGFYLHYTTIKKPMKEAFKEGQKIEGGVQNLFGLRAKLLLQSKMDPYSYADLEILFENFPTSVIEFSTYSICIGNMHGRNTLIWEVRNY